MQHRLSVFCLAALSLGMLADTPPGFAADDTWISASGTNAGACTIDAPCRSLQYALAQTTAGGTITILSSGRYGPVRINKSVHIMAAGVEAIVTGMSSCDAAVCIDAGPNDVVSLHGLTVQVPPPYQAGSSGITFTGGAALHLSKFVISGIPTFGIFFEPNAAAHLHVFDSKLTAAGIAAVITGSNGTLRAVFDRTEMHDGNQALQFQASGSGSIQATIRESLIASHWGHSILLAGFAAAPVNVMLDRSVIANGNVAVDFGSGGSQSNPLATVRMGDSVVSGFRTMPNSNQAILSYGTNKIVDAFQYITDVPMK